MELQAITAFLLAFFVVSLVIDFFHRMLRLLNFQVMCEVIPVRVEKRIIWLKLFLNIEYLKTLHYFLILVCIVEHFEPKITIRDIDEIRIESPKSTGLISAINKSFGVINPQFKKLRLQFEGGGDGTIGEI